MTATLVGVKPVEDVSPLPLDGQALVERLRMTLVAVGCFLLFPLAIPLFVLSILATALGITGIGFALAWVAVPATQWLTGLHRRLGSAVLGEPIPAVYAATPGGFFGGPIAWLRDPHRWRDVGYLAYASTGGTIMSGLPPLLLVTPLVHVILALVLGGWPAIVLVAVALVCPPLWWILTPPLVRARGLVERSVLGDLEGRIEEVEQTRAETVDHSASELRRIERDLHDGAQARIAAVGMNVGLAEKLMTTDPEAAAQLLREARETTVGALEDLRSVVRGIRPPALADEGLVGAVEALAVAIPLPVTVSMDVPTLPEPVQAAAYFAVAECLTNTVKHAGATRAWVRGTHDGRVLRVVVGDDGRGGADPAGSGLAGVARRLAAFDGTMDVDSPPDGPTVVTMEVPCP